MNISEIEPDSKITLSKFNFNCDDIDESIPKPLPQMLNFFMLICGRPGSGKTTLILNLISKRGKMYNKKFDKVFVFSPSLTTMKEDPFGELPPEQVHTDLSEENLEEALSNIRDSGEKVLFHTRNKKEIDTIFDEIIIIPQKDFYEILKYCFSNKNKFLYIDINKSHTTMFHKCFNQLTFNSKNDSGLI